MRKQGLWKYSRLVVLTGLLVLGFSPAVFADTSSSSHYSVSETDFGAGSTNQTCSGNQYCAATSLGGGLSSGNASSANYTASFGPITPNVPMLDVIVNDSAQDLGVLDSIHTGSKTTSIKIRNYLSSGYSLQITGSAPKIWNHALNTPSTPTASAQGTEQFGINLAANTSPTTFGAAPVQVPSGTFSFGVVNSNYNQANKYMYNSGAEVAHSPSQSGETDYTVSMILNVANNTPAGKYVGSFSAVVIPVY